MQLPGPFRAAIGLAATAADEVRRLPDRAIELPMLAVSTALQMSLRAQQRYARLTARGDEVLGSAPGEEPPAWATFDEPVPADELRSLARSQLGDSPDAARLLDELFGAEDDDVPPPTPITAAKKTARPAAAKSTGRSAGAAKARVTPSSSGKKVSKPRHTAPSKFDDAPE